MKIDLYTKTILTIIAICLMALTLEFTVTKAYAQNGPTRVTICNIDGTACVDVKRVGPNIDAMLVVPVK
jgi:hypothetical protein